MDGLTSAEREELTKLRQRSSGEARARDPAKGGGLVRTGDRPDPQRAFGFVKDHQAVFRIATMCRVLPVSPSGFYAWRERRPRTSRAGTTPIGATPPSGTGPPSPMNASCWPRQGEFPRRYLSAKAAQLQVKPHPSGGLEDRDLAPTNSGRVIGPGLPTPRSSQPAAW